MADEATRLAADLIRKWEGFRPKPYLDSIRLPTIGYGTTRYPDGRPVSMSDPAVTVEEATALLEHDMAWAIQAVDDLVTVKLRPGQKAALVSFTYNVGRKAFGGSTLLRRLNLGDFSGAVVQFGRWNLAGGKVVAGLTNRRADEARVFAS